MTYAIYVNKCSGRVDCSGFWWALFYLAAEWAHRFASGSSPKRLRALHLAAPSYCEMGGPSFHQQMFRQPNHCVIGANMCTLVKDLTWLNHPPIYLCEYPRQCRRTCQVGEPISTRFCCVDKWIDSVYGVFILFLLMNTTTLRDFLDNL